MKRMSEIQENVKTTAVNEDLDVKGLMEKTKTDVEETPVEETAEAVSEQTESVEASAVRDENMDLQSLMKTTKKTETVKEEASPIDQMINKKQTGIVVTNEELEEAKKREEESHQLKSLSESDERNEDFENKKDELTELAEKAKKVLVVRKPNNPAEDSQMMDEISQVTIDEFGNVVVPEGARYIIPKPSKEEMDRIKTKYEEEKKDSDDESSVEEPLELRSSELTDEEIDKFVKRKATINIIIDKTNLGQNVTFTESESRLISEADEIHVTEVENVELESIRVNYDDSSDDDLSFMDDISQQEISIAKTNMTFPASGFRADMLGLSWAELTDITLDFSGEGDEDYLNFDKMYKKFSVIYKKMRNISCGKFENFEDFLKKFAFVDVQLATYGLLISTQPEEDSIGLQCQKDGCKMHFNQKYRTRSLIDFNTCGDKYLESIKKISEATSQDEYVKIAENSDVRKVRRMKLPYSGFIVEVGPTSLYDYLYKTLKVINVLTEEEKRLQEEGKELDDNRAELSFLLQVIRAIKVPKKDGTWTHISNPMKMLEIIDKFLPPKDIEILSSIFSEITKSYGVEFSVKKAVCPNCGYVTENIPVSPDELVFYARQRLSNTTITVDNFQEA